MPWKNEGSYEHGKETLHGMQRRVYAAKSIVVGGAGPTGVETAGELGFEYGKVKEITLVSSCFYLVLLRLLKLGAGTEGGKQDS